MSFLRCECEFPSCVILSLFFLMTMTKVALALSSFLKTLLSTQYLPGAFGWPAWPPGMVDQPLMPGWLWSCRQCEIAA